MKLSINFKDFNHSISGEGMKGKPLAIKDIMTAPRQGPFVMIAHKVNLSAFLAQNRQYCGATVHQLIENK
jgi:hypothetical protein